MSEKKQIKTVCGMCPWACGIIAHVEEGRAVKVAGDPDHPWNRGKLCPKAAGILEHVYSPERIKYPMKKVSGEWKRITWDEALEMIASQLNKIKETYGAKSWVVLEGMTVVTQGLITMRFLQRFCDAYGSPNYFTPETLCYLSIIVANMVTFGKFPSADPENSQCILLWGHNPSDSNFMTSEQILRAKRKGAKLIVIDPRRTALANQAEIHAQIRPGTDYALALSMLNVIISEGLYDKEFVEKWTTGFNQLRDHVKSYSPEEVEKITWVPRGTIETMARTFASVRPACIVQGINALSQQSSGFQNHRAINILQAITGNLDVPGGFISADLGGTDIVSTMPNYSPLRLAEMVTEKTIGQEQFPLFVQGWTGQGMLLWDMILTGKPYPVRGITVVGSNPLITWPNTNKIKKALESLDFLAVMTVTMNETAQLADIVLPAASFLERTEIWEVPSISFNQAYINLRNKVVDFHESWSDLKFWLNLGKKMGYGEHFPWKDTDEMLENVFEPTGIEIGKYLGKTNFLPIGKIKYKQYETEGFKTPSGKVELYPGLMKEFGLDPLPPFQEPTESPVSSPEIAKDYPIILTTGSRNAQYTHSSFREIEKFRKSHPEPFAEIHPTTAERYQIGDGDRISVETRRGAIEIRAKVTEDIVPNVINIPHGWPQSNVNVLTDEKPADPVTGYPALKALLCRISPLK